MERTIYIIFIRFVLYSLNFSYKNNKSINFQIKIIFEILLLCLEVWHMFMNYYILVLLKERIFFVLIILGFLIRIKSRYDFEKFYITKKIVKNGIYKYICHPDYTGQGLIIIFSIMFYKPPLIIALSIIIITIYVLLSKIKKEENILREHFSDDYTNYLNKTSRFFPFKYITKKIDNNMDKIMNKFMNN